MKPALIFALAFAGTSLHAETRQLDAHEHGVGALDIAVDGGKVVMAFHAPGADIVGFEHPATRADDKAAIKSALARLEQPLSLFALNAGANCTVTKAHAALAGDEDDHHHDDDHGHDDHGHDDHGHDDHEHDDHGDHADETNHTEFHAEYSLTCANPDALEQLTLPYFDAFSNARELAVQIVTNKGASAGTANRSARVIDLGALF